VLARVQLPVFTMQHCAKEVYKCAKCEKKMTEQDDLGGQKHRVLLHELDRAGAGGREIREEV
jgi:hypothetical protein